MTTKKWFICSDVHDDVEALARFLDYAQAQQADAVVHVGDHSLRPYTLEALEAGIESRDLGAFIMAKRTHNESVLRTAKELLDKSQIPYVTIPGNYDPSITHIFNERDVHLRSVKLEGIDVFGYGGAELYPPHIDLLVKMNEIVKFDERELAGALKRAKPKVLVLHTPPYQMCDLTFRGEHWGAQVATRYIVENWPKLVMCGHVHESGPLGANPGGVRGVFAGGDDGERRTIVINPGNLGRFELVRADTLERQMALPYGTFAHVEVADDGTALRIAQYRLDSPERDIGQVRVMGEASLR
jgi:Icc-related predicted phosphoesterase